MPWLLTSPGHQRPWCWLCWIGKFLSYFREDFNCVMSMWRNDIKYEYMIYIPVQNVSRKGLTSWLNSLRSYDVTWRNASWSLLVQWIVACPMPIHHLNQWWFIAPFSETLVKFESNLKHFLWENASESAVCQYGGHYDLAWICYSIFITVTS